MTAWLAWIVHLLATAAAVFFVVRRGRTAARPVLSGIEIAVAAGAAAALLGLTSGPVLIDFIKAYHHAGRAVLTDPSALYDCTRAQCFVNIPVVAVAFVPFAVFDPYLGGVLFSVAGVMAFVVAVHRLAGVGRADAAIWLAVLSGPLYYSVRLGNTTHILLLALVAAFGQLAAGRQVMPGVLLGGAALLKPPLALLLPYLLLRRRHAAAAAMAAVAGAAVLVSLAAFGTGLHRYWFQEFVLEHGGEAIGAYNVQSAGGFLAHLITRGHLRDWYPVDVPAGFHALRWMMAGAIAGTVFLACRRAGAPRSLEEWHVELSLVVLTAILVAPIAWTHYYVLALIPLTWLASGRLRLPRAAVPALWLSAWLISLPVVVFGLQGRIANALYERLLVSHHFLGGALLLGVLIAVRTAAAPDRQKA